MEKKKEKKRKKEKEIKDLTPVRGQDGKISDTRGKDFLITLNSVQWSSLPGGFSKSLVTCLSCYVLHIDE
jgi:hypothetical protein